MNNTLDISIRRMSIDDVELVLSWRNHNSVKKWILSRHHIAFEEHLKWFSKPEVDDARELLVACIGGVSVI